MSKIALKVITFAVALAACSCISVQQDSRQPQLPAECSVSEADRLWIDHSLEAWRFASREIAGIRVVPDVQAILFSGDCVLRSENALRSPTAEGVTWTATAHSGSVSLPDGSEVPVGVTSYASGGKGSLFFVMATPTIWTAAGIGAGSSPDTFLIPVLLHEASHIAQIGPYGPFFFACVASRDRRSALRFLPMPSLEGFALVMALDRIAGPDWKRHAFGDGALTVPEMLDEVLRSE